jgi:drug/metabolite transporter (DMT)-like permease
VRNILGQFYLWFAILIFGAANAVTRKLTEIGARRFIDGHNPISFCNVLFVGNLCALTVLILIYGRQWKRDRLRQISRHEWLNLTIVAVVTGALVPGLVFQALALTAVNSVIIVGRLEPPLTLALSVLLLRYKSSVTLGDRVTVWEMIGALISFVGVVLSILLPANLHGMAQMNEYFNFGLGEILAAIAAIASAASTILINAKLSRIPLGIYSIYRTALGTLVFYCIASIVYGKHHFMEAFSPFLWQWMLIYGPVIVVVGQSSWIAGLRASSVSQISLISSFTPIVGVVAAYLILGEIPTLAQYIGGITIIIGIVLGQVGIWRKASLQSAISRNNAIGKLREIESEMGFKGM